MLKCVPVCVFPALAGQLSHMSLDSEPACVLKTVTAPLHQLRLREMMMMTTEKIKKKAKELKYLWEVNRCESKTL